MGKSYKYHWCYIPEKGQNTARNILVKGLEILAAIVNTCQGALGNWSQKLDCLAQWIFIRYMRV
jgi:hypothetical protein